MTKNIERTQKNRNIPRHFPAVPGALTPSAAFAVLSQHVLSSLPASPVRRENLLRALVCCAPQRDSLARRLRVLDWQLLQSRRLASLSTPKAARP